MESKNKLTDYGLGINWNMCMCGLKLANQVAKAKYT